MYLSIVRTIRQRSLGTSNLLAATIYLSIYPSILFVLGRNVYNAEKKKNQVFSGLSLCSVQINTLTQLDILTGFSSAEFFLFGISHSVVSVTTASFFLTHSQTSQSTHSIENSQCQSSASSAPDSDGRNLRHHITAMSHHNNNNPPSPPPPPTLPPILHKRGTHASRYGQPPLNLHQAFLRTDPSNPSFSPSSSSSSSISRSRDREMITEQRSID